MKTPLSRFAHLPAVSFVFSLFSLCHTAPFLPCPLLPRPLISIFLFYSLLLLFISSVLPHIRLFLLSFLHSVSLPTCLWPVLGFQALCECSGTSGKKKKKGQRSQSSRAAGHAGRPETAARRMCVRSSTLTLPTNPDPALVRAARRREKGHSVMDKGRDVGERDGPALCGHHDIYRKSLRVRWRVKSSVSV